MNPNTNPPAFPNPSREFVDPFDSGMREKISSSASGMTLRDYFAAKAMAGWLASYSREGDEHPAAHDCQDSVAKLSYELADAMLKARNKPTPSE